MFEALEVHKVSLDFPKKADTIMALSMIKMCLEWYGMVKNENRGNDLMAELLRAPLLDAHGSNSVLLSGLDIQKRHCRRA